MRSRVIPVLTLQIPKEQKEITNSKKRSVSDENSCYNTCCHFPSDSTVSGSRSNYYEPWKIEVRQSNSARIQDGQRPDESWVSQNNHGSQEAILNTLKHETDNLLRTPLSPRSLEPVSEDGYSLSVEAAKTAYDQGWLSTGSFHRDCLPPALLCSKIRSSSGGTTGASNSSTSEITSFEDGTLPPPNQQGKDDTDTPIIAVKRRNMSEKDQLRRLNQAPLSAIYEESTGPQPECTCGLCSGMDNRRGIVWFHLCPRYRTMAQEKGFRYESYEGRVLLHHSPDRESVGLIIEGPMEDRYVPAPTNHPVAGTPASEAVSDSQTGKVATRPIHTATGRSPRPVPRTTSSKVLHSIPGLALRRPILPATQISYLSSFNTLSPGKEADRYVAQTATQTLTEDVDLHSACVRSDSQQSLHPALRNAAELPKEWSRAPTRSQSLASIQDPVRQGSQYASSEDILSYSDFPGKHPVRRDSLGALTHLGLADASGESFWNQNPTPRSVPQHKATRQSDTSTASSSILSPSIGHRQKPSVFLAPSTPSTASFQRSSISSYDETLPLTHVFQLREAGIIASAQEHQAIDPFQSSEDSVTSTDNDQDGDFTPLSYHTAPASHDERSPLPSAPAAVHINQPWTDNPQSKNIGLGSPFVQPQRYLRSQASKHSFAQSFTNLNVQRNSVATSSASLLNSNPFDTIDLTNQEPIEDAGYDAQYTLPDTHRNSSIYPNDPLLTVDAIELTLATSPLPLQSSKADTSPLTMQT